VTAGDRNLAAGALPRLISRFAGGCTRAAKPVHLTYYSLANGKIVEDDPIQTPDLTQEFAALMPPPVAS
jgi:hypothetical protein